MFLFDNYTWISRMVRASITDVHVLKLALSICTMSRDIRGQAQTCRIRKRQQIEIYSSCRHDFRHSFSFLKEKYYEAVLGECMYDNT